MRLPTVSSQLGSPRLLFLLVTILEVGPTKGVVTFGQDLGNEKPNVVKFRSGSHPREYPSFHGHAKSIL